MVQYMLLCPAKRLEKLWIVDHHEVLLFVAHIAFRIGTT